MRTRANGVRTALLLGLLGGLVLAAGYGWGGLVGLVVAAVAVVGLVAFSWFCGDRLALRAMHAFPVSEVSQPALYTLVRELATAARQPLPRLYLSPTTQPNAFATGRSPRHAAVCCTEGLLQVLDTRELRAVLSHELSHVYNRDILTSSVAGAVAGVVTSLAMFPSVTPIGGRDDQRPSPLADLLLAILGPFAAALIQLTVSRSREYDADADAAHLTDDPLALAGALRKIHLGAGALPLPPDARIVSVAHLMIHAPVRSAGVVRLFDTHPPVAERVRRLEELARARRA